MYDLGGVGGKVKKVCLCVIYFSVFHLCIRIVFLQFVHALRRTATSSMLMIMARRMVMMRMRPCTILAVKAARLPSVATGTMMTMEKTSRIMTSYTMFVLL